MKRYEPGDRATFYFIVLEGGKTNHIQAWTDSKDLAKFYLDFHKCKNMIIKSVTKSIEEISRITEENWGDEIQICNIIIKNHNKRKKGQESKTILIPATSTEITFINEECATFMMSEINYSYLNTAIPYLKRKYKEGLDFIFLPSIVNKVCNRRDCGTTELLQFDQLMVLFKAFPDNFGE